MTRSGDGRFRQFQPLTRSRPPRGPVATLAASVEVLPNAGYDDPSGLEFVDFDLFIFNENLNGGPCTIPGIFSISNGTLALNNSPASVPHVSDASTDALNIHITNTALPCTITIYGSGTSGHPVMPCSRYSWGFGYLTGGAEGNDTFQSWIVNQYDASGALICGGNPTTPANTTGSSVWGYFSEGVTFDTEPNAAYVQLQYSITGRTADHDLWTDECFGVQYTTNSRLWNLADFSTLTTDLLQSYCATLDGNPIDGNGSYGGIPLPTTTPTFTCTGLPYDGTHAAQDPMGTDGTRMPFVAYGPIDVVASQGYDVTWAFGGIFDSGQSERTAMLWLADDWTPLDVDYFGTDGIDNSDGCWVPVAHSFIAHASAAHALLLVSAGYAPFNETAWDLDGQHVTGPAG